MILRATVVILLLANLLFLGWTRGWFMPGWPPPRHGDREPERVAAQVRPEAVTVLAPRAASAALSAARAAAALCLEAGPLQDAEVAPAEAALVPAQLPEAAWVRVPASQPDLWLVYAGRVAGPAQRRAREEELKRRELTFEVITTPADLAPGLVLSRHPDRAAAESALAATLASAASAPAVAASALPASAPAPALRGLRVVSLPVPPPQYWLRVPRAEAEEQARLQALPAGLLAGGFKPCAPRP